MKYIIVYYTTILTFWKVQTTASPYVEVIQNNKSCTSSEWNVSLNKKKNNEGICLILLFVAEKRNITSNIKKKHVFCIEHYNFYFWIQIG